MHTGTHVHTHTVQMLFSPSMFLLSHFKRLGLASFIQSDPCKSWSPGNGNYIMYQVSYRGLFFENLVKKAPQCFGVGGLVLYPLSCVDNGKLGSSFWKIGGALPYTY